MNRLKDETSPYLRQHMDNPVDWMAWGPEAFTRAREADKPILLSIGYSACHWCHVMAHESFEDAETAAQMNRDFINIKVDREEHPDVDQVYQHALQLFGENGGWPLTMFLLPTGEPFYGGTYFPPREAFGRPSFRRVLSAIFSSYQKERSGLLAQAGKVVEALAELEGRGAGRLSADGGPADGGPADGRPADGRPADGRPAALGDDTPPLSPDLVQQVVARLSARMDPKLGGFQGAPKFPNPTALSLFLRSHGRTGTKEAAEPALLTLSKMAAGGIYDHLGGGFARYSTDEQWLVPHFEKMLYDNAQLLRLYAQARQIFLASADRPAAARCAEVIAETHGWLEREMRDGAGGLYAAQDADSEGVEGKFFVWTPEQVEAVLPPAQARQLCRLYDVRPGGNWSDRHGHGPRGASILHWVGAPSDEQQQPQLVEARARLLRARSERTPPGTDDKVLCGWNGLAITGLAEAGRLLGEPRYIAAARRTADFVLSAMVSEHEGLLRTYKNGTAKLPATLDDHAFLAEGLFHLAMATQELRYLLRAAELTEALLQRFYDGDRGLFFLGPEESAGIRLCVRPVSFYDSAIPSGLSVTCMNLLRLAGLFYPAPARYMAIVERTLRRMVEPAQRNPFGLANLSAALDLLQHGLTVIVIVDPQHGAASDPQHGAASDPQHGAAEGNDAGQALVVAAHSGFVPDLFVLHCHPDRPLPSGLDHHRQGKTARGNRATAYICRGPVCSAPIQDASELRARLGESGD